MRGIGARGHSRHKWRIGPHPKPLLGARAHKGRCAPNISGSARLLRGRGGPLALRFSPPLFAHSRTAAPQRVACCARPLRGGGPASRYRGPGPAPSALPSVAGAGPQPFPPGLFARAVCALARSVAARYHRSAFGPASRCCGLPPLCCGRPCVALPWPGALRWSPGPPLGLSAAQLRPFGARASGPAAAALLLRLRARSAPRPGPCGGLRPPLSALRPRACFAARVLRPLALGAGSGARC